MARSNERRRVAERLHSAAIHVLRHARQADRHSAMGPAQLSALSVLVFGGPCSLRELADAEQVAPPTITRIVAALRRGGYVRLAPSPDDARSSIVEATTKGTAALEKARAARLDLIDGLLSRSAPADIALLGKALAAIFPQAR
jgi:DNA-binding MarR family transcriptional regulator